MSVTDPHKTLGTQGGDGGGTYSIIIIRYALPYPTQKANAHHPERHLPYPTL